MSVLQQSVMSCRRAMRGAMRVVSVSVVGMVAAACAKEPAKRAPDSAAAPPAAAVTPAPASSDTSRVVTPAGYGPVRVGASAKELAAAIGTAVPGAKTADDRMCRYVYLNALPKGVRVMLAHDTVVRIEVDAAGVATGEGASVGDTEQSVLARYGARASVMPHKYTGPVGHYVIVPAEGDTTRRTVFETDGRTVLRYRAGRRPEVDFVEGCA